MKNANIITAEPHCYSESSTVPAPMELPAATQRPRSYQRTRLHAVKVPNLPVLRPLRSCIQSTNVKPPFLSKTMASRQSGAVGVSWDESKSAWVATYRLEGKLKRQQFRISKYFPISKSWKAADQKARVAAIRARNVALEQKGAKGGKKPRIPHSGIKGIYWETGKCAWRLHFGCTPVRGNTKSKIIFGGYFHPKAQTHDAREAALNQAQQALVRLLEQRQITYIQKKSSPTSFPTTSTSSTQCGKHVHKVKKRSNTSSIKLISTQPRNIHGFDALINGSAAMKRCSSSGVSMQ